MSLPWFPFNIKDFLANTKRLNTEAKGAYLCLMLDYYEQEKGAPDDDDVLAAITELPLDAWKRHRKVIEPMFDIHDGRWFHSRIDAEIKDGKERHAKSSAKGRHAALAKADKNRPKESPSTPKAPATRPPRTPRAHPEPTHSTNTLTLSSERVNARAQGDEIDSKAKEDFNPLGTVLPVDWVPDDEDVSVALGYGMDNPIIHEQLLIFHALNAQKGTFSKNWKGTWRIFCSRWKDLRKTAPPPPRVEVNTAPLTASYERAAELWARGGASTWSHQLGPEPGQIGCRCPLEILTKHKIDPKTGLVAAPSKEPVS